jgi:plasmid stability protein
VTYLIRDIDPDLWTRVKVRAAREGESIRSVLIRLLRAYVAGRA